MTDDCDVQNLAEIKCRNREVEITDEMKQLCISGIRVLGRILVIHNTNGEPICCQYDRNDHSKTR
jgi:hypothetical protein